MTQAIDRIEEDKDRARKAQLAELATQMLSVPLQDLSSQEIDQIQRIGEAARPAIAQIERPGANDDLALLQAKKPARPTPVASKDDLALPEMARVISAASGTPVIGRRKSDSVFSLSADRTAPLRTNAPRPVDASAASKLAQEAESGLRREMGRLGDLTTDEMADLIDMPASQIAENALLSAAHDLQREFPDVQFPNLAREMLRLNLKMEAHKTEELEKYREEGDKYRAKIQTLLKLSAFLDKLPSDRDSHNVKEEILDKLEESEKEELETCIHEVFPGESYTISKEQLTGGKVRVSDIMGEHKTAMTNLITTKISIVIHLLQLLTQISQDIPRKQHQLVSTIVGHYGGR